MTAKIAQQVNDARLEADAWRETASRWRKRALREGAPWRRKCRKLEADLDDANERAATLAEERDAALDELGERKLPVERGLAKALLDLADEQKLRQQFQDEVERFKRKMGTANSVEALVVERDELLAQVADQKSRVSIASNESTKASSRAYKAEQEAADAKERFTREQIMPAKARLRVLATRLGIDHAWPGYGDDEKLSAELDRRIFALQKSAAAK